MSRQCDAIGCRANVASGRFMCIRHWQMVPQDLQRTIYQRYLAGRRDFAFLSDKLYLQAAVDAVDAVAKKDGVKGPNPYSRHLLLAQRRTAQGT